MGVGGQDVSWHGTAHLRKLYLSVCRKMNHPELIAVPVLMLADYALTVWGAKNSAAVYRKHFRTPSYELNPLWRKSVDQIRWFNPRHIALVALVTVLLVVADRASSYNTFELALGMLFGAFGSVCSRHLTNLMLFRYLNRHPNEISGQVQLSMKLVLKISQLTYLGLIPLFSIVVAVAPSRYTVGVLLGILTVALAHFVWARRAKSAEAQPQQAIQAELIDTEA